MFVDPGTVNLDLVMSITISFSIGVIIMIIYNMLREQSKELNYRSGQPVVEAIISEYSRRLRDYDKIIAELQVKTDTIELRMLQQSMSQNPNITSGQTISQYQSQSQKPTKPLKIVQQTVTSQKKDINRHNNITDDILKLLVKQSRTSREIQHAIGRTREHTARLMKALYVANLVSRDSSSKPFKYNITDAGYLQLKASYKITSSHVVDDDMDTHAHDDDAVVDVAVAHPGVHESHRLQAAV
jgi:hypothetical protein